MFKMLMRDVGIIHYTLFYKKYAFHAHFLEKIEAMRVILLSYLATGKRYLRW